MWIKPFRDKKQFAFEILCSSAFHVPSSSCNVGSIWDQTQKLRRAVGGCHLQTPGDGGQDKVSPGKCLHMITLSMLCCLSPAQLAPVASPGRLLYTLNYRCVNESWFRLKIKILQTAQHVEHQLFIVIHKS